MSARYMEMPKERHDKQEEKEEKKEKKEAKRAAKVGVGFQVVVVVSWQSGDASCSRN